MSVRIKATDARTPQPVKSLSVVPAPQEQAGRQRTWQSHRLMRYVDVPIEFRMEPAWDWTMLRIEADGYLPFVTRPIRRGEANTTFDVAMEPDPSLAGTVLTPNGKPASGASLALCTWTNEVTVEGGRLRFSAHGARLGKLAQSAADGSFRLPSEVDPWVLVIAHDGGYAEVTAAELAKSSALRLKPWGRIQGEFVLRGQAGHRPSHPHGSRTRRW